MPVLVFVPMDESGFHIFRSWFTDAELQRRFQLSDRRWFDYVRNGSGIYAWLVYENDVPIGQVQLDVVASKSGT